MVLDQHDCGSAADIKRWYYRCMEEERKFNHQVLHDVSPSFARSINAVLWATSSLHLSPFFTSKTQTGVWKLHVSPVVQTRIHLKSTFIVRMCVLDGLTEKKEYM